MAQDCDWDLAGRALLVPIGNAGNVSAIMAGLLKLLDLGIITSLPKVIGVQSHHADPVFRYYQETDPAQRVWQPVTVQDSVAQAAMIGNPVSMPRVIELARRYDQAAGRPAFFVVQVDEQAIIEWCKENMTHYKVPSVVEFREELPKTMVGKVLRRVLKEEELSKAKPA